MNCGWLNYTIHVYGDAIYTHHPNNDVHVFYGYKKSEDMIKSVLQRTQPPKKSTKMYVIHNTLTGKDMLLHNRKVAFRNKSSATQSFISYMVYDEKIKDFNANDFHKLVESGLIEVRELV